MPDNKLPKRQLAKFLKSKGIRYEEKTWENFSQNLHVKALIIQIDKVEQVVELLQEVNRINQQTDNKLTVRAAAGWQDKEKPCCCFFPFKTQYENHFNESFSFNSGAVAEVIVRFSPKFQMCTLDETGKQVTVRAGVQISTLANYLEKKKKSLTTVSMIPHVSAVGLALNAGHGTGRNEPSFAGLIEVITLCDYEGNIRTIKKGDKDFDTIRAAKAGLFGIVLSIKLACVDAFSLKEAVHYFNALDELKKELPSLMTENEYFTLMHIPPYKKRGQTSWQVLTWNKSNEKHTVDKASYVPSVESFMQFLSTMVAEQVQDVLMANKVMQSLIPLLMALSATIIKVTRGESAKVGKENYITHPQVTYPRALHDLSFLIQVTEDKVGESLANHLEKIDELLQQASDKGEYPVTYAVYARYFKGTNGGLSTSATALDDERILALEVVTHPEAPGFAAFEKALVGYFKKEQIPFKYHLGKNIPASVNSFYDFYGKKAVDDFKQVLAKWHGGESALQQSPFVTPYFSQMLQLQTLFPAVQRRKESISYAKQTTLIDDSGREFLTNLVNALTNYCKKDKRLDNCEEVRVQIKAFTDEAKKLKGKDEQKNLAKI